MGHRVKSIEFGFFPALQEAAPTGQAETLQDGQKHLQEPLNEQQKNILLNYRLI